MKKSELQQIIREEISKTLNEGAILKAIKPALTGEVKVAVEALEKLLQSTGAKLDYKAIADCVIDIIDAAKQEERDEYSEY
jgi:hypothetical protein